MKVGIWCDFPSPFQTLLNQGHNPIYFGSIIPAYIVMIITGVWAYMTAGGSMSNFQAFVFNKRQTYDL